MPRNEKKIWRCPVCSVISLETAILRAKNPFDVEDWILGCPHCKSVCEFDEICDEPGCEKNATCGFPAGEEFGGYRRTCGDHYRQFNCKAL